MKVGSFLFYSVFSGIFYHLIIWIDIMIMFGISYASDPKKWDLYRLRWPWDQVISRPHSDLGGGIESPNM